MKTSAIARIDMPAQFVEFAKEWHDSQSSMLYAVASTGGLTLGTVRPLDCESDEEWHINLYDCLDIELSRLVRDMEAHAERYITEDIHQARQFQKWAEAKSAQLNYIYFGE